MSCVTAQCSSPPLKNSGCFLMEYAISELPFASVSERVLVHNLSYENEFNLQDNRHKCRTHFHMKGCAPRLVLKQR